LIANIDERGMMRARLLILALIIIILSLFLIGCSQEPVSIESIIISRGIGEDFVPVDPTNEFNSGTSIIYISVEVKNMTPEDKLTVTWNYLETGEEQSTTDFSPDKSGSGYQCFSLKRAQGFSSGDYNALVYLNDELYETMEFLVK
jgi:hypothetical protein